MRPTYFESRASKLALSVYLFFTVLGSLKIPNDVVIFVEGFYSFVQISFCDNCAHTQILYTEITPGGEGLVNYEDVDKSCL